MILQIPSASDGPEPTTSQAECGQASLVYQALHLVASVRNTTDSHFHLPMTGD